MKYRLIGRLNSKEYIEKEFGELNTDEVIVMDERLIHIQNRHLEDFELFEKYIKDVICFPDYIIKDHKNENTVFMIKKIEDTNLNAVVKVNVDKHISTYKNSIITFYRMREKNLQKLLKKWSHLIIYKK